MKKSVQPLVAVLIAAVVIGLLVYPDFGAKELVPWRADLAAARAEAERVHKPVFVEFTATWCGYCKKMAHTTWADKAVAAAMEAVVPVQIDVDAHRDLARQYNINPIPAYVLLDSQGHVLKFGEGYRSPDEFLAWLKEATRP